MTAPKDIDRADVLGELEYRFKESDANNAIAWVLDELAELDILRFRQPAGDPSVDLNGTVRKSPKDGRVVVCARHLDPVGGERRCWIDLLPVPHRSWLLVDLDVVGWPVIGSVPGTPAAEQLQDETPLPEWEMELLEQEAARRPGPRPGPRVPRTLKSAREPRVFSSDGPEPPPDVVALIDNGARLARYLLRRSDDRWQWSKDLAGKNLYDILDWATVQRVHRNLPLVEVLS